MLDLVPLIKTTGYLGLFLIVFAESGLLVGFFLPGDSLLFTAGFLASQGYLHIDILIGVLFLAAIIGDNVGYGFGKRVGPRIFTKEDSLFFHKDHLLRAQKFFAKHGGKALILARFMPVIRTFTPILAGVGNMPYRTFVAYNLIGGFLWTTSLTLAGYFLGKTVPGADQYVLPIVIVIIVVSLLPSIYHVLKDESSRKRIVELVKGLGKK